MTGFPQAITLELPPALYQALIAYQQQCSDESPSSTILRILEQFLHSETLSPNYATQEQLQQLEARVNSLFELLSQKNSAIADSPIERKAFVTRSTSSYPTAIASLEEIEDEPDEILYDFLE